jgi:transketolase
MSILDLHELAAQLRVDSIRCSTEARSGHPTSSLSAADLMAVLLRDYLRWDVSDPDHPNSDHLIFSKGHASPLLYAMLKAVGAISDAELLSYRRLNSRLEGHPVPTLPWVDVATGSLGQGLPIGVGIAIAAKYLEHLPYRVWVLLGDGEMSEGSIWEAFEHARYYRLGNLVAILDMNRLGQTGQTPLGWDSAAYAARANAFGWRALQIDGHDVAAIDRAYAAATHASESPALVIARTVKGKGVSFMEDERGHHGKALDEAQCTKAIAELGGVRSAIVEPIPPSDEEPAPLPPTCPLEVPRYDRGTRVATRQAYGESLAAVGAARTDVVVLDGDVSNSTYAEAFAEAHPSRFFEMFIAEQQMVAAAVGMSVRGFAPFASTFAAFLTRATDFIRMAAVSRADIRLCGSHAGVSIGEDGPSQMGLEDVAMMRAIHGSTVLYPCCANQTASLVAAMVDRAGIVYLRTTREKTPVLYSPTEDFPIGGSKVLKSSPYDHVTVIAAGITVHEALRAHERLAREGTHVRVIDAYSIEPIDSGCIRSAVAATGGRAIVVEDHRPQGGLGEAVLSCLASEEPIAAHVVHLAVRDMPGSAPPDEQLHAAGIDADAIAEAARRLIAAAAPVEERVCFICGAPATWRIMLAGEDEAITEEDACDEHASGHRHVGPHPPIVEMRH